MILFSFCFLSVNLTACKRTSAVGLYPGDQAPDFTLTDLDGKQHSLRQYKDKVVLLNFWASWCAPCIQEMPELEKLHKSLAASGFQLLSIAVDDQKETLDKFRKEFGLSFPVLLDLTGEVKRRYRVSGYPETFVLNKDNRVVLFPDIRDKLPVVRIIGPREWASASARREFEALLKST